MHVTDCALALMAYQRRQEPITPPAPTPIRPCLAICPLERQYRPGIRGFSSYYFKSLLLVAVCCRPELPEEGMEAMDISPVSAAPLLPSVGCTTRGNVIPTRGLNFLMGWDLLLVTSPSLVTGPFGAHGWGYSRDDLLPLAYTAYQILMNSYSVS